MRLLYFLLLSSILFCKSIEEDKSNFSFLSYLSRLNNPPSSQSNESFAYPQNDYTLIANTTIIPIQPIITGNLSNFKSTPPLPSGILIDPASGIISGTPAQIQVQTSYTISATGEKSEITSSISLTVQPNGLLRQYTFTGGSYLDHNNSNPLTPNGSPINVIGSDGDSAGAILLNGSTDYLSNTSTNLPLGSQPRTLCAWINPSNYSSLKMIFSYGSPGTISASIGLAFTQTNIGFVGWGNDFLPTFQVPLNTWTHLCGTYDGTTATIYVNGSNIGSSPYTLNTVAGNFYIGNWVDLAGYFPGKIDNVQIYNKSLNASEIRNLSIRVPAGLMAMFDFQGDTLDLSINKNNGTIMGGATLTIDRFGQANSAYLFNGSTQYINVPTYSGLPTGNTARTICAWFRSTTSNPENIVSFGTMTTTNGNGIAKGGAAILFYGFADDTVGNHNNLTNIWVHSCGTYNGATATLYMNGAQIGSLSKSWNTIISGFNIGRRLDNVEFFTGSIDDVRIYNRVLSINEIRSLSGYNPMQTSVWSSTPASSGLKLYFQSDSLSGLANNATVSSWTDQSGNLNTLNQGTGSKMPTFLTNGLNGRNTLKFLSANMQELNNNATVGLGGTSFSIFAVAQPLSLGIDQGIIGISNSCGNDKVLGVDTTNFLYGGICNLIYLTSSSFSITTIPNIFTETYQHGGGGNLGNLYQAGNLISSQVSSATPFSGSTVLAIGRRYAAAAYWNGHISEVLFFDSALGNADRELVECYLSSKYGIGLGHSCP
ncbi:MAG TPA: LamG domain-containing protein [Leptospiraceae bacterium]|nr:LamG domain-containing protein [Leptospiraceae bacterium]HMW04964.1 LamG domain-containing protein [Leptospiraceae bacterium]HMX31887.1 LamG domain-containing protein [Leptospiraceae bacterium]HMY30815.1 LamG domain-containing protein [Leptospiraceae bacterium]HNA08091.1 LamG domain-containing protein [Leptospiraceae bacterium]